MGDINIDFRELTLKRMAQAYSLGHRKAVLDCYCLARDEMWSFGVAPFMGPSIEHSAAMIVRSQICNAMWTAMCLYEFEATESIDFDTKDEKAAAQ